MCLAIGVSCPADYRFAAYGFFTNIVNWSPTQLTVTECYKPGVILNCSTLSIPLFDGALGTQGNYSIPVVTNTTGTERLLGCVISSATACPTQAAVAWLTYDPKAQLTTLDKCSPSSDVSTCPASGYSTPGVAGSALTACIRDVTGAGPSTTVK
jgi:hypothetical protein